MLEEILIKDKFSNLERIAEILKGEMSPIVKNFLLVDKDIVVRYRRKENKFVFDIEIEATRIKTFGGVLI